MVETMIAKNMLLAMILVNNILREKKYSDVKNTSNAD